MSKLEKEKKTLKTVVAQEVGRCRSQVMKHVVVNMLRNLDQPEALWELSEGFLNRRVT